MINLLKETTATYLNIAPAKLSTGRKVANFAIIGLGAFLMPSFGWIAATSYIVGSLLTVKLFNQIVDEYSKSPEQTSDNTKKTSKKEKATSLLAKPLSLLRAVRTTFTKNVPTKEVENTGTLEATINPTSDYSITTSIPVTDKAVKTDWTKLFENIGIHSASVLIASISVVSVMKLSFVAMPYVILSSVILGNQATRLIGQNNIDYVKNGVLKIINYAYDLTMNKTVNFVNTHKTEVATAVSAGSSTYLLNKWCNYINKETAKTKATVNVKE